MVKSHIEVDQAVLMNEVKYISKRVDELTIKFDNMESRFVTQEEWKPIKNIVNGVVALLLTSVIVALVALVIRQ